MFTAAFWKATGERIIFVFAYTLITSLFVGAELLDISSIRWGEALTLSASAAGLALLKCLVASQVGVKGSPGLVADPAAAPADPVDELVRRDRRRAAHRADLERLAPGPNDPGGGTIV